MAGEVDVTYVGVADEADVVDGADGYEVADAADVLK